MLLKKTCILSNNLSKNVHLKVFWTLFKNVHCRGPCILRPCISRPYCRYNIILKLEFDCLFSTYGSFKNYPKISGYLDRISKMWIRKKLDIQSIQVSMYPKKTDIHVSKYPCIQISMISKYPLIQVSKENQYPRYPSIRISKKSGIHSSLGINLKKLRYFQ